MHILKEGKLKEAQKVDFIDVVTSYVEDKKALKDIADTYKEINTIISDLYKGEYNPAMLYSNIQHCVNKALDSDAATYVTYGKASSAKVDEMIDILNSALDQAEKTTKGLTTKLTAMSKLINKLPKKV